MGPPEVARPPCGTLRAPLGLPVAVSPERPCCTPVFWAMPLGSAWGLLFPESWVPTGSGLDLPLPEGLPRLHPTDMEPARASGRSTSTPETQARALSSLGAGRGLLGVVGNCHKEVTQTPLRLSWPCLISSHIPFPPQVPQARLPAWLLLAQNFRLRNPGSGVVSLWGHTLAPCGQNRQRRLPRTQCQGLRRDFSIFSAVSKQLREVK